MRRFYTLLLYLLVPVVLLYLAYRGIREPGYRRRWRERFGFFNPGAGKGGIWVHAVSMGEVNAAAGLIRRLAEVHKGVPLYITTFTPTGSARVRELFGDTVFHVYSPLDLPGCVRRFLDRTNPRIAIVMETEIWPNLFRQAEARGIPLLIANARISDRSFGRYRRFRKLSREALRRVDRIAAQSLRDAARLIRIGADAERVMMTGNLKFDLELDSRHVARGNEIRRSWGAERPVLVAGSTHDEEERALLKSFAGLLQSVPNALLVLVPRHPDRFDRAAKSVREAGLSLLRHSTGSKDAAGIQCYLVDRMGELMDFYAAADVAFVGGSLEPVGGHNVLEPAALGKPVIVGPYTSNFADITGRLLDAGAAIRVADAGELQQAVQQLFDDRAERLKMGRNGRDLVESGQGAVARTLDLVRELLSSEAD